MSHCKKCGSILELPCKPWLTIIQLVGNWEFTWGFCEILEESTRNYLCFFYNCGPTVLGVSFCMLRSYMKYEFFLRTKVMHGFQTHLFVFNRKTVLRLIIILGTVLLVFIRLVLSPSSCIKFTIIFVRKCAWSLVKSTMYRKINITLFFSFLLFVDRSWAHFIA